MKKHMWQTRKGWWFLSVGGDIYLWHIAIGRFTITWEIKDKARKARRKARTK